MIDLPPGPQETTRLVTLAPFTVPVPLKIGQDRAAGWALVVTSYVRPFGTEAGMTKPVALAGTCRVSLPLVSTSPAEPRPVIVPPTVNADELPLAVLSLPPPEPPQPTRRVRLVMRMETERKAPPVPLPGAVDFKRARHRAITTPQSARHSKRRP